MYPFSQKLFVEMDFYEPKTSLIWPWIKVKTKYSFKKKREIWQKCQEVIDTRTFETEKYWVNNNPLFFREKFIV